MVVNYVGKCHKFIKSCVYYICTSVYERDDTMLIKYTVSLSQLHTIKINLASKSFNLLTYHYFALRNSFHSYKIVRNLQIVCIK